LAPWREKSRLTQLGKNSAMANVTVDFVRPLPPPTGLDGWERRLFSAVICQAFADATQHIHRNSRLSNPSRSLKDQADARKWLTGNSRDFRIVCEIAGVDAERVRAKALTLQAVRWARDELRSAA
jgi:hypothetical protein